MTDNSEQKKGLVDLMAEKQIEATIEEYISRHLTKDMIIGIGTEMIAKHIMPVLNDNPNVFIELAKGAWAISYDNKYGFIVSKGKAPGFKYIAYLLQKAGEKFRPIQLEQQFAITNDKANVDQYDEEISDNIESGIIDDKLDPKAAEQYRSEYITLRQSLKEAEESNQVQSQKDIEIKEAQKEVHEFENFFSSSYGFSIERLFIGQKKIPKDKSTKIDSLRRMVARHIKNALDLIGEDPNISHLKDYLDTTIKRGDNLIYTHDPTKPSWKIILK